MKSAKYLVKEFYKNYNINVLDFLYIGSHFLSAYYRVQQKDHTDKYLVNISGAFRTIISALFVLKICNKLKELQYNQNQKDEVSSELNYAFTGDLALDFTSSKKIEVKISYNKTKTSKEEIKVSGNNFKIAIAANPRQFVEENINVTPLDDIYLLKLVDGMNLNVNTESPGTMKICNQLNEYHTILIPKKFNIDIFDNTMSEFSTKNMGEESLIID